MVIKLIGLGNRLYGDDAIGSITAECLNAFDASANGFEALAMIEKDDIVIFIDAMIMDEEYNLFNVNVNNLDYIEISDPHRLSPIQILSLSAKSNKKPKEAYILAIKPEKIDWPGLSDKAIERLEKALNKYKDFFEKMGIKIDNEKVINCVKEKKEETW